MTEPANLKRRDFTLCPSQLDRLEQCPGFGVYVLAQKEKPHVGQWYGIFVHRFLEYCVTRGHEAALAYIRSKGLINAVRTCERIDPDQLYYGEAEVGWAHNPFLDVSRRVSYSLLDTIDPKTEQYGKADLVVTQGVERPMIGDYKCGAPTTIDEPSDRVQLVSLAAAYRAETGSAVIDVAIGNVKGSGDIVWQIQAIDSVELDRYIERTKKVHLRVWEDRQRADLGRVPDFVRGNLCDWCNLKKQCPAWT